MLIEDEIVHFEQQGQLLSEFITRLAATKPEDINQDHIFLAEAVMFRLFRIYERLTRAAFLFHCVSNETLSGTTVQAKLKCPDWDTAEAILEAGNKFLDWGNVESTQKLAGLVFEQGFPLRDVLSPIHSDLKDLQRFRNFVSHDSSEAESGFQRSRTQYVRVGDPQPDTVGKLALYRRNARSDIVLRLIHSKVTGLPDIIRSV